MENSLTQLCHPSSNVTTSDAIHMILGYYLRHNLTWKALEHLLELVRVLLGNKCNLPPTKYFFKKNMLFDTKPVYHFYCRKCKIYLGIFEELSNLKNCLHCEEPVTLSNMNGGSFFIYISLKKQIEGLLKNNEIVLNFNSSLQSDVISDFCDGKLYKKIKTKNNTDAIISLTINTDGVNVYKSKRKSSLWPLQMIVNELPIDVRFKSKNIILCGIWYGTDPDMKMFFKPFIDELNSLETDKLTYNNKTITVRAIFATMDSVARCKVQYLTQFNGKFGCTYCFHPGTSLEGRGNNIRYKNSSTAIELRTHSNTIELMKQSIQTKVTIYGVKGISPLIGIPDFDLIDGVPVDYMHCVLLGVVQQLLDLWFDSRNHKESFYIGRRVNQVNENIKNIKLPKLFTRKPRLITDRKYWKANECRSWLLYYGIPCLANILPLKYLKHFSLLSDGIWIFLTTNITTNDYKKADSKLSQFVAEFEKLYGVANMVYNVHLISHLANCVMNCGPLWAYSNFNFEHNNGVLVSYVNGTTDVEKQVVSKYLYQNLLVKSNQGKVLSYIEYISTLRKVKNVREIGNVTLLNQPTLHNLSDEEKLVLRDQIVFNSTYAYEYKKFILNNDIYYSSSYKRAEQTNDTRVKLNDGTYCQIDLILELDGVVYLLVTTFDTICNSTITGIHVNSHLKLCEISSINKKCVPISNILKKCIFISTSNFIVITEFPNRIECD